MWEIGYNSNNNSQHSFYTVLQKALSVRQGYISNEKEIR